MHFLMMLHLRAGTYFLHSSPPTRPPKPQPAPFDRGHSNAVLVAEFRDLYPGGREIFELAAVGDPIKFSKMSKMFLMIKKVMSRCQKD